MVATQRSSAAEGILMQRKRPPVASVLTFLLCGVAAFGQSSPLPGNKKPRPPADYQPRTLKKIISEETQVGASRADEDGMILHGNILPSRVRATYAGSSRPLTQSGRRVLTKWAQRFAGDPTHYTGPYETEMLFSENGTKHWLAVRKNVASQLGQEIKKGEAVELFLIRLGRMKTGGRWELLLLVESFQKAS